MIVCICARVSDREIRQAAAAGAQSLDCLQFELGVAVQCGRCADCASRVLRDAHSALHGPVHPHTALIAFHPRAA